MMVAAVSAVIGHIETGRLRGLAVSSPKRLPALPNMPTVMEAGYKYQVNNWHGVIAPKGTPKAIVDKLNSEINKAVKDPDFAKRIAQDGLEPAGGTSEAFGELLKREVVEWAEVVKAANVTAN
jgi:tripartite-type tricarboxylate transporter receptor subunit TctC